MSVEFFRTIVSPMGQRGEAPGAEPSEQPNDSRVRFAGGDGDDGPSTTPTSTARKASMGARLKDLRFQSQVGIALSLPSRPAAQLAFAFPGPFSLAPRARSFAGQPGRLRSRRQGRSSAVSGGGRPAPVGGYI